MYIHLVSNTQHEKLKRGFLGELWNTVKGVGNAIGNTFGDLLDAGKEKAKEMFGHAVNKLGDTLMNGISAGKDKLNGLMDINGGFEDNV